MIIDKNTDNETILLLMTEDENRYGAVLYVKNIDNF